jgi:hypothetical protein
MEKKKEKIFHHCETDMHRITMIEGDIEDENDQKDGVLNLKMKDDDGKEFEFELFGFMTLKDPAGDDVIHLKIKSDERLVLYLPTEHPDCTTVINKLKEGCSIIEGQVRDVRDDIEEMIRTMKKIDSDRSMVKEGIHPNMEKYLKE